MPGQAKHQFMAYHIMRVWLSLNGTVMALHCLFTPQRSQGDLWDLPSYKQFLAPAVIIYKILFPFLGVSLILVCIPFHISDGLSQWMDILCQINLFSFFFFCYFTHCLSFGSQGLPWKFPEKTPDDWKKWIQFAARSNSWFSTKECYF